MQAPEKKVVNFEQNLFFVLFYVAAFGGALRFLS